MMWHSLRSASVVVAAVAVAVLSNGASAETSREAAPPSAATPTVVTTVVREPASAALTPINSVVARTAAPMVPPTTVAPVTLPPPVTTTVPPEYAEYLNAINTARSTAHWCGTTWMPDAPPLTWDSRLATAAALHSQDQLAHNTLTHTGSNGSNVGDRLTAQGYSWNGWGENAAAGYTNTAWVMEGWMGSPGHCSNIMNASFTDVGMGRAGNYWTQDFASHW